MSPTNTEPKRLTDHIKSTQAIEAMREAGKITASVFEMLDPYVTAGVSLNELDQRAQTLWLKSNVIQPLWVTMDTPNPFAHR